MAGRRLAGPRSGDRGEYLALYLLSKVAQAIPVPRQEDFGIDIVGALLEDDGRCVHQGDRFEVQIKTGEYPHDVKYGGRRKGKWQLHEVDWLFNRCPLPVFIGYLSIENEELSLFTTMYLSQARTEYLTDLPPEVTFMPYEGTHCDHIVGFHEDAPGRKESIGIPMGNAVAILNRETLGTPEGRNRVVQSIARICRLDEWNRQITRLGVPAFLRATNWSPNEPIDLEQIEFSARTSRHAFTHIERSRALKAVIEMAEITNQWLVSDSSGRSQAQGDLTRVFDPALHILLKELILLRSESTASGTGE